MNENELKKICTTELIKEYKVWVLAISLEIKALAAL